MKKYILLFIFTLVICSSKAQTYTVVHVTGKSILQGKSSDVQRGDQLKANEKLTFPGKNAWMIVLNEKGQHYFLQQPTSGDSLFFVGQLLQVIEKTSHPLTRSDKRPVKDLRKYFAGDQFIFITSDFHLAIDSSIYPLDEKLFLLYRYEYNGRIITHKVPHHNHVLQFKKSNLYQYKGDSIPVVKTGKIELTCFNAVTNLPTLAASFRAIWLNEQELIEELQILKKINARHIKSESELKKICLQYVLDIYGKTDEVFFMEWLDQKLFHEK